MLEFEKNGDVTTLSRCRFKLPLQVQKPSYIEKDRAVSVYLLNPTGGIVGGDRLRTSVRLGCGAHVCLGTPSATTVYRTLGLPAAHQTDVQMEPESVLEYFPEHLIPYPGSALRQSVRVEMAPGSCLLLNEAFAAGRIARHERWRFNELTSETEIRLGNSPVYISRSKIVPSESRLDGLGITDNFNYFSTLVVVCDGFKEWSGLVKELSAVVRAVPGVQAGVSRGAKSSCVVRAMTSTAAQLTSLTQKLWTCVRQVVLNRPEFPSRRY